MQRSPAIAVMAIAFVFAFSGSLLSQGAAYRISAGLNGTEPDWLSVEPVLSSDGQFVAFQSYASNLVANDTANIPTPIVKYYLGIAQYLGSNYRDVRLELFVTESERREAEEVLARSGLDPQVERPARRGLPPMIILNPGAQYGGPSAGCRSISRSSPTGSSRSWARPS